MNHESSRRKLARVYVGFTFHVGLCFTSNVKHKLSCVNHMKYENACICCASNKNKLKKHKSNPKSNQHNQTQPKPSFAQASSSSSSSLCVLFSVVSCVSSIFLPYRPTNHVWSKSSMSPSSSPPLPLHNCHQKHNLVRPTTPRPYYH